MLVSEFMLQQTPVARVLPIWTAWLERWPTPDSQAADAPAETIRAWGRLGYPRRALRLHETATILARDHRGQVPADASALRALPGVGDYTAGAILAFAYGQRALALDTNVRRVIARHDLGQERAPTSVTVSEVAYAESTQPQRGGAAWMAAVMELGALVCTSRAPACGSWPVAESCRWLALGRGMESCSRKASRREVVLRPVTTASRPVAASGTSSSNSSKGSAVGSLCLFARRPPTWKDALAKAH